VSSALKIPLETANPLFSFPSRPLVLPLLLAYHDERGEGVRWLLAV
jgi:hypothetical protein